MDIIEAIEQAAQNFPDKIAHISDIRTLSYGELGKRSDVLAGYFTERYSGDTSPVAILGHKEPEMLIGFLAAVKSGRPYVPIDISIPAHRADRIVQSCGAIATLTPPQIATLSGRAFFCEADPTRTRRPLLHYSYLRQQRRTERRGDHAAMLNDVS